MTTPLKPQSLGPFLGVSNRREDFALAARGGDYLKAAVNVDITNQGKIKRRRGAALIVDGLECHSLHSDEHGAWYVDNRNLYRITGDDGVSRESAKRADGVTLHEVPAGKLLSYAHDGVDRIFTDGVRNWRVMSDDRCAPLGPPPLLAPTLTATTGGSLSAGVYQVGVTQVDPSGRESPCDAQQVTVQASGAIVITGLPATFPEWVTSLIVYVSHTNGDEIYRMVELISPLATFTIPVEPSGTGRCMTRNLSSMPAGDIIRFVNGRTWVAAGSNVYYSEPWAPHLYDLGFIPFASKVTLLEVVPNGVFIATDQRTWFLGGNPADANLQEVFPYGAIPRTSQRLPDSSSCWWMSTRGACIGNPDGSAKNLQEAEVVIDPARVGASLTREQDGVRHLITGLFNESPAHTRVGSFMEAV